MGAALGFLRDLPVLELVDMEGVHFDAVLVEGPQLDLLIHVLGQPLAVIFEGDLPGDRYFLLCMTGPPFLILLMVAQQHEHASEFPRVLAFRALDLQFNGDHVAEGDELVFQQEVDDGC